MSKRITDLASRKKKRLETPPCRIEDVGEDMSAQRVYALFTVYTQCFLVPIMLYEDYIILFRFLHAKHDSSVNFYTLDE